MHLASFSSLATYKQKKKGAEKGYSLLKKKSDALTIRYRQILGEIIDVRTFTPFLTSPWWNFQEKTRMGENMKGAFFSLAAAKYAAGDFGHTIIDNVKVSSYRVKLTQENIAGVRLPTFTTVKVGDQRILFLLL